MSEQAVEVVPTQLPAGYPVALGRNVYPQKHDIGRAGI